MDQFDIVFEKLKQAVEEERLSAVAAAAPNAQEIDEIDELRRFAADIIDPEPVSYTST